MFPATKCVDRRTGAQLFLEAAVREGPEVRQGPQRMGARMKHRLASQGGICNSSSLDAESKRKCHTALPPEPSSGGGGETLRLLSPQTPASQTISASLGHLICNFSLSGFTIHVSAAWPNCDVIFICWVLVVYPGFFICLSLNLLSKYISAELELFLLLFLLAPWPILKAASLNSQFTSG